MPDEKCLLDPQRDCYGLKRAEEVAGDVRILDQKLSTFQQSTTETINKFGGRIGKLEAHNEVQDEQMRQVKETQSEIKKEIEAARREQKDSISELRKEHKESMEELKSNYKEILSAVTPMKHKIEDMDQLREDVDELKGKPGKTWEDIKSKALGWVVALILAIIAGALGLSKFL